MLVFDHFHSWCPLYPVIFGLSFQHFSYFSFESSISFIHISNFSACPISNTQHDAQSNGKFHAWFFKHFQSFVSFHFSSLIPTISHRIFQRYFKLKIYENKIPNKLEDRWFCHTDYMILLPYLSVPNVPNDRMKMNSFALCVVQHKANRYNMEDKPQHCIRYALCPILMDSFCRTNFFFFINETIQESSIIIQNP